MTAITIAFVLGALSGVLMAGLLVSVKMGDKDAEIARLRDERDRHAKECQNIAKAGKRRKFIEGAGA
jgi:hypothetical protein